MQLVNLLADTKTINDVTEEDINKFVVLRWEAIQRGDYPNIKL